MYRLALIGWAAVLIAQPEVRNPRTSPEDVALGEKTFRSHCAACHGYKGDGGRGPNLSTGVFYHGSTDANLLANISNGIAGTEMPGLFYSPDRVWQVVAYLRSLNAASNTQTEKNVADGEKLFAKNGCDNCHRINGVGGSLGPDLSEIGKTRAREHLRQAITEPNADVRNRYWLVSATAADGNKRQGFLMNEDTYSVQFIDMSQQLQSLQKSELKAFKIDKTSTMPSYKSKLTEAEVDQLVNYLSSLRPAGGVQ